jgi:hypothetical protein
MLARRISRVLSPCLAYSGASAGATGDRVAPWRWHFGVRFDFHAPRSNECTKSFLLEGQK